MLPREKFHVDAFKAYTSGDLPGACVCWEASIVEYPRGQYVWFVYCQVVLLMYTYGVHIISQLNSCYNIIEINSALNWAHNVAIPEH